jgi:hypothetical protein
VSSAAIASAALPRAQRAVGERSRSNLELVEIVSGAEAL